LSRFYTKNTANTLGCLLDGIERRPILLIVRQIELACFSLCPTRRKVSKALVGRLRAGSCALVSDHVKIANSCLGDSS
jgi:hypothetical protein